MGIDPTCVTYIELTCGLSEPVKVRIDYVFPRLSAEGEHELETVFKQYELVEKE